MIAIVPSITEFDLTQVEMQISLVRNDGVIYSTGHVFQL